MCQMKIMMDKEGQQELVMEDVAHLEVIEEGIRISTLFEEPKLIPGVVIKTIDFLSGKAMLQKK
ncbi:MAG: CooT family nickel-binding protein [Candidatus Scalindua rubra]|uniref:Putative RNA-binding protein n=1 Tax=Candidatus Scalindua brodae TaxID=237368 RepID=A0A0B0EKG4_9BACT|nr:MAG: putative RNA-binding protein [Candidatus Scalindua brodae]MBZ0107125.1 CooT family nickel-binding protein [Candidatus Scalindua rubra]TWU38107.1 putative RNA-binding protein [Candidatus Brocadiaceae bacterium S225]